MTETERERQNLFNIFVYIVDSDATPSRSSKNIYKYTLNHTLAPFATKNCQNQNSGQST